MTRHFLLLLTAVTLCSGQARPAAKRPAAPALPRVSGITPELLKAHVAFLASDALEGRGTPSRGQDAAAEYIAAQFRRIGFEPEFQDVNLVKRSRSSDGFEATLKTAGQEWKLTAADAAIRGPQELNLQNEPVVKLNNIDDLGKVDIKGKVVVTLVTPTARTRFRIAMFKPKVVLYAGPKPEPFTGALMLDPSAPQTTGIISDREDIRKAIADLPEGATLSVTLPAPKDEPVSARNVFAVLPGSSPALKDTYVVVSAHYDHVGLSAEGNDRVYNGANDNASGTSAVLALAEALSARKPKPRRSIVFLLVTAEEVGLFGSEYFVAHSKFPKTIANINLEQVGRTDNKDQPTKGAALMTGFEFSDLGSILKRAAAANRIRLIEDPKNSKAFFLRSDNAAFAQAGVPSATYSTAFEFPDYHAVGDEWQKLDYENMAQVTRSVGTALLMIANNPKPVAWNKSDPDAAKYAGAAGQ